MKVITLGSIRIDNVDGQFIRLTVDASPFLTPALDELEASGITFNDALVSLHEQVEEITA